MTRTSSLWRRGRRADPSAPPPASEPDAKPAKLADKVPDAKPAKLADKVPDAPYLRLRTARRAPFR